MSSTAPRKAGASLLAFLASPACKAPQQVCRRAAHLQLYQRRTASYTTTKWQQAAAATPSPSTSSNVGTTKPASRAPVPQTTASKVAQPDHALSPSPTAQTLQSLTDGLVDPPPTLDENEKQVDWTRSFHGLSSSPFSAEQSAILMQDITPDDIEIKPDGILYLPEIKYRRILNKAFGPGGWGLAPRGETIVTGKLVTREYGLVCGGR
jgi:hypothetical protein